jgi:hypothetical protein
MHCEARRNNGIPARVALCRNFFVIINQSPVFAVALTRHHIGVATVSE